MISRVSQSLTSLIDGYRGAERNAREHVSARGLSDGISVAADEGQSRLTPDRNLLCESRRHGTR